MARKDPRIDAYIAKSPPFAQPILKHLRKVVHAGCPEVQETIKWNMPHFDYKGLLCGMGAFKAHCAFGFWREAALALGGQGEDSENMGQFGRLTSIADLPDETTLVGYVRKAVEIKDSGVKFPKVAKPPTARAPLKVPADFAKALQRDAKAKKTWDGFSYSHRKEYVEWITEAKRTETRRNRLATSLAWLADGKPRMWKYQAKHR